MIHSDRTLDTEHDSPRKTRLPTAAGANAARTYDHGSDGQDTLNSLQHAAATVASGLKAVHRGVVAASSAASGRRSSQSWTLEGGGEGGGVATTSRVCIVTCRMRAWSWAASLGSIARSLLRAGSKAGGVTFSTKRSGSGMIGASYGKSSSSSSEELSGGR